MPTRAKMEGSGEQAPSKIARFTHHDRSNRTSAEARELLAHDTHHNQKDQLVKVLCQQPGLKFCSSFSKVPRLLNES